MDTKSHIYSIRTPIGKANAFRLGGTNYLLTTDTILRDICRCDVYDSSFEPCDVSMIVIDTLGGIGILYLRCDSKPGSTNYRPELVEDSYDVTTPTGIDTISTGYISNFVVNALGQTIYYHSISLSSESLGSPLLDENGFGIAIHNSAIENDEVINYANPIKNYLEIIAAYEALVAVSNYNASNTLPILHRCQEMNQFKLFEKVNDIGCCFSDHDSNMDSPKNGDMIAQISEMLSRLNFDTTQSKLNKSEWEVTNGSAKISIVYHENEGLLLADAVVANHQDTSQSKIYEYLLRQNYILEGLTFSVVDQDIILSMKLHDNYIEFDTMLNLFKKLLLKADELDDILILTLKK